VVSFRRIIARSARVTLNGLGIRYARKRINGREYLLPLDGYSLKVLRSTSDTDLADGVEAEYMRLILDAIKPGQTVFDIGTYRGHYTLAFLGAVGESGQVVAFEPNPYNMQLLHGTVSVNKLTNVTLVQKAVGDQRAGKLTMWVSGIASTGSLRNVSNAKTAETVEVDVTSVDQYVAETSRIPHFLKIDVEGAELLVLRGAEETLRRLKPIVACEIHAHKLPAFDHTAEQVDEFFASLGYTARPEDTFLESQSSTHAIKRAIYRPQ
jgi:FkbM family methyltransferase